MSIRANPRERASTISRPEPAPGSPPAQTPEESSANALDFHRSSLKAAADKGAADRWSPCPAEDAGRTPFTRRCPGGNVGQCCQNAQTEAPRTICSSRPGQSSTQIMAATSRRWPESSRHLARPFEPRAEPASSLPSGSCPAAQPLDRGICSRYQRAAASWPTSPPPSHERFAAALASLHGAADAARLAARRCDRAREAVDVLLRTSTRCLTP